MRNLYYVPMYHYRENHWARWMVTDDTETAAQIRVEIHMGPDWRPGCVRFVCRTKDDVCLEV